MYLKLSEKRPKKYWRGPAYQKVGVGETFAGATVSLITNIIDEGKVTVSIPEGSRSLSLFHCATAHTQSCQHRPELTNTHLQRAYNKLSRSTLT